MTSGRRLQKETKTRRWYRPPESYRAKTPEAKERQLAGLKNQGPRKRRPGLNMKKLQKADIITFATEFLGLSFAKRPAQEVLLRALYGLPLDKKQLKIYQELTGNKTVFEDGKEKTEGCFVLGARSGKSFLASVIALYEATRTKWQKYLSKGETAYCALVATRLPQAQQIIQTNCLRMLENSVLKGLIEDSTQTQINLRTGISIMSLPCNSTSGRGLPLIFLCLDEVGHFFTEGVKQDELIYGSLRPRLAQFPGAKALLVSTPSAKQGLLWTTYNEGPQIASRLTVRAATRLVNPLIPEEFIETERRRNPDNAEREFDSIFSEQVASFLPLDALNACFSHFGDLPYSNHTYACGIDQSGIAGADKFGFAISHKEDQQIKVDVVRSWDTKDSEVILADIKALTETYLIHQVYIDRYAKGWITAALEKIGLEVFIRPSLPEIYVNLKSLVISGRLALPEHDGLKRGLAATQAYYGRSNTLSIAHERTKDGHGDEADAMATAVWAASKEDEKGCEMEIQSFGYSEAAQSPMLSEGYNIDPFEEPFY